MGNSRERGSSEEESDGEDEAEEEEEEEREMGNLGELGEMMRDGHEERNCSPPGETLNLR